MQDDEILVQAGELERLMPALARRLFTVEPDDPGADLPVAQLRVCRVLEAGSQSISCLAEELRISASAVTQLADRLEKAGLVERVPESDDRRMKRLVLTENGRNVMRERRERRVTRAAAVLQHIAPAKRRAVMDAVRELLAAISTGP